MRRSTHPHSATTLRAALALVVAAVAAIALAVASSNAAQPEAGTYTQVSWSSAASQPVSNSEAQGVVVGGKLYSFGGFDSQKACCTPTSRAYAFDPATDAWTALTPIPGVNGRPGGFTHAGIATDGQFVYLAGGYIANAAGTGQVFGTREVWRFDPAANAGLGSYTRIADLPSERAGGQLAVANGNLHFFGGSNLARTADTPEHWALPLTSARTSGGTWAVKAPMANARHHMGSAVLDGKIYAIGGQDEHDEELVTQADVDVYDPATNAWSAAPADLPPVAGATGAGRGHISSATVVQDGRIVVMGGESAHGAVTNEVVAWRPGASAWTKLTPLPAARRSGVAGVLGGRLYYSSGDSAATYRGAPVVMGGCADVSELTCAQVRANLPLRVDFTGTEGGLYDAQGQDLGLTMVQKSTTGQYRPERLDVDGGVLRLTTTSGINFRKPEPGAVNPNSLDNGLGVGVDASKPLRIETTVIRPALGSGASEQPAVWFGPDQDNYVKVDVVSANPASPTHRPQIVWEVAGVPNEVTIDQPGTDLSGQDVRLILETDPVTRIATGYLQIGTAGRTVIGQTTALPQSWFAAPTAPQGSGFAGIFGTHRNRTTGPITYRFADFAVTDLTPAPDTAPNMEVATTRLVASDASGLAGGTTKSVSVRNTGGGPLTLQAPTVADDPAATGDDAGQFTAANRTTTIPAGGEGLVDVTFAPTTNGVKSAYLTIRGDDPDAPTAQVKLRGLGITNYSGGASEPSLQRILDAYEIPVDVGDPNPADASMGASGALLGQEVSAQTFEKAGAGDVTVETLAQFSPEANPTFRFGHHAPGTIAGRTEVMAPANRAGVPDHTMLDDFGGVRSFGPAGAFALYTGWPQFAERVVSTVDTLNTWETSTATAAKHKIRVYPVRTPAGADVPNAYVIATEEVPGLPGDFQDHVAVVRNVKPVVATGTGEVTPENLDREPFADRLVFNRIQNPESGTRCRDANATGPCTGSAAFPVNVVHDEATVRLRNTHATEKLTLTGLGVDGPWQVVSAPAFPRELAPNGTADVRVKFVATTPTGNPINRQFLGTLNVLTSDADEPVLPVQLAGRWQRQSEGGAEPDVNQIVADFGYGTTILKSGQQLNNGGELVKVGDEVHSKYWKRADTTKDVRVRQLGAFHTQGNTATFHITRKATSANSPSSPPGSTSKLTHAGEDGQSYLPRRNDSGRTSGEASFAPTAAETGTTSGTDAADGTFGFRIDPEYSDWDMNRRGVDGIDQGCLDKQQTDPKVVCGHHLRTWPAEDRAGRLIPNTWLVVMDYAGINYDFNDNVYLVENVKPEDPAVDPNVPKPCAPVACDRVTLDPPVDLDFGVARTGTVADADGTGTGFTWVDQPSNGTGYVPANLDQAGGELRVTTTAGLAARTEATSTLNPNSQDNALGVGVDWQGLTPSRRLQITTTVLEPPAVGSLGKAQQAGLWFGEGQDDYVKVHVFNDANGWTIETVREVGGVFGAGVKSPVLDLAGKSVRLKLVADPATRKVVAYYEVSGGAEQRLGEWDVPAAFFNQDLAAIDNRTGTSSFAGLFASHRNGEGPLVFRFADFGVGTDATQQRPSVANVTPAAGATGVFRDAGINMGLNAPNGSVDNRTITADTLRLERVSDSVAVDTVRGTSGGGDVLTMQPVTALAANTQYRVVVTDGLKDLSGAAFVPFTSTFTTGAVNKPTGTGSTAKFTKVLQPTATAPQYHGFTSLEMEPTTGDQLYALRNDGLIKRFPRAADGTLGTPEELTGLRDYAQRKFGTPDRLATGMVFDPSSTKASPVVWITHTVLGFADMADWTGEITRLSGANLQNATTYVVGLPRSARDHVSNSLVFKDGKLYFPQGSNSAMGEADAGWGWRRERMLTGAILELDPAKVTSPPLNVKTPEPASVRTDGRDDPNLPDFCKPLDGKPATKPNDPACSDPVVRTPGTYDPWAAGAPLKVYASGIRNAYDLLWHSSGRLYTAANGSADGGNSPATPAAGSRPAMCASRIDGKPFAGTFTSSTGAYAGGAAPEILNIEKQHEWLFRVERGGYYGHPNPRRCEYVMNGGNPTTGIDVGEVLKYPAGKVEPDPNYRGAAFDIGYNKSPNGTIEYKSNRFGGSLAGKLLIVRYSNDDDVLVLDPREADGDVPADGWQTLPGASAFRDPLDLIEDEDGGVYVSEYDQLGNGPKITYLRPDETTTNPTGCDPVSTLPCSQVKVADTHVKSYDPATDAGGLKDADGQGTGFTMVQPNTAGDQYQPADLDVTGGALTLTAQKGIQFKSATTGGSGAFNALKNGLGAGLDGTRKVRLETTLVNPPFFTDTSSQQGGLWFGPDQDNYVKLVVVNRGGYHGVQLLREQAGAATTADEVNQPATAPAPATNWSDTTVRLVLEVDPATRVAEAWYQIGTAPTQRLGSLTLGAALVDGSLVGASPKANGIGNYGGIFASKRNAPETQVVKFTFDDLRIETAGAANRPPVLTPVADRTTEEGSSVDFTVEASDPDFDVLAYSATDLPAGLSIDPVTGRIAGTLDPEVVPGAYDVTVKATDPDGLVATDTFRWTITAVVPAPALDAIKVNFQSAAAAVPAGHVRDFGKPFGERSAADQGATNVAGLRYGWVRVDENGRTVTDFPLDLSVGGTTPGNGRDRNLLPDQRLDTLMHMQGDDVLAHEQTKTPPGTFNGTAAEGAWELAIADGVYDVTVAAGDPAGADAGSAPEKHFPRVENRAVFAEQFIPPSAAGAGRIRTGTLEDVVVTDGRLTLDAIGGVNTKVLHLDLVRQANTAPVVDAIADRSGRAGDVVDLALTGTDADGDVLTWSAAGLPAGLAIDAATGTISGTIAATAARELPYEVTVTATDDGLPAKTGTRTFAWTVAEADAPVVDEVAPAAGATAVALGAVVTARFNEAVEGVGDATFTLRQGETPVPAAVTYDADTRTATLDPSAALAKGTTYTATVKGGPDGVRDATGNPLAADRTWTFTTVTDCPPFSTLPCGEVKAPLPVDLDFEAAKAGSIAEKDGDGTGFTMVQPNGGTGQGTQDGHVPGDLDLAGGRLQITAQPGIQYRTNDGTGDPENAQQNAVGVGLALTRRTRFETTLVDPALPATGGSEQAGLWLGGDQDNYVKVVVAAQGSGTTRTHRVQLARETAGGSLTSPTGTPEEVNAPGSLNLTGKTVRLRLDVTPSTSPATAKAEASYSVDGGAFVRVGELVNLPAKVLAGAPDALKATGVETFAGVFATKRNNSSTKVTTPITYAFEQFSAAAVNVAPVMTDIADQTGEAGTKVHVPVTGTDADGDAITWSATGLPGTLAIDPVTGLITGRLPAEAGTAEVTVKAASTGDLADEDTFTYAWTVAPAPAGIPDGGLKVDFGNQAAPEEAGYVEDYGKPYGVAGGQRFGWVREGTNSPLDLSVGGTLGPGNGRNRATCTDLPQKERSIFHMQLDDLNTTNGVRIEGAWEVAVPDGLYDVTVGVGDPNSGQDRELDVVNAEGRTVVGPNEVATGTASCVAANTVEGSIANVRVTDGRLTLDAVGGFNTKIAYVDIVRSANRAPELAQPANRSDKEGATVDTTIAGGTDADGDALTYSATGLPAGLAMSDTGRVTGTITAAVGDHVATVKVTDGKADTTGQFIWTVTDGTAPKVSVRSPEAGATGVALDATVVAGFDEAVAADSVTGATVQLRSGETLVPATVSVVAGEAVLDPTADLATDTTYTVRVDGVEDVAGNVMTTPATWSFTTRAASASTLTAGAAELVFGDVAVGGSLAKPVTVTNSDGERTIQVTGVEATGGAAARFTDDQGAAFSLAPGASRTVTVTYAPTTEGADASTLRIEHDGSNPAVEVALSGTGVDRTPWAIADRTPAAGATGVALGGDVTATFGEAMQASTVDASSVLLRQGTTTVPADVTYSAETRTVTLDPQADLFPSRSYTVVVTTAAKDAAGNAPAADVSWSFTTRAPEPSALSVSDASLAFGDVNVGQDATRTVTLRNEGTERMASIQVTGVAATGGDAAQFADDVASAFTLAPGATRQVAVTFAPASAGAKSSVLRVTHDGAGSPTDVALGGTGVATAPARPTVRVNMAGPAQTVGTATWAACTSAAACGGGTLTGGSVYDNGTKPVYDPVAPANAAVYRHEWTGGRVNGIPAGQRAFGWARTLPNGHYLVRLHFADHNQDAVGKRVFDVDLEGGTDEMPGFDVFKETGRLGEALVKEVPVELTDGTLNVDFIAQVENAFVNGIEVIPTDGTTPPADTTKPTTTITGGPAAGSSTTSTSAQLQFTADEAATFRCALDGGEAVACTSPRSLTGLSVGEHTFTVRAVDVAGNVGDAVSRTWTVTAPTGTPVRPGTRVNLGGPAVTVDGTTWGACTSAGACVIRPVSGVGSPYSRSATVTGVASPASAAIYQTGFAGPATATAGARTVALDAFVPNGRYLVRLHFAETKATASTFTVDVNEGTNELVDLTPATAAGGLNRALVREVDVNLTDGKLDVDLFHKSGAAFINAIEILPETTVDTTPPAPVGGLTATPGDARVDVRWTNPAAADFNRVKVFRSTSTSATSPNGGSGQTLVYEGAATGHTSTGLTNGTRYVFTVFALDGAGNASKAEVAATPVASVPTDPARPTTRVNFAGGAQTVGGVTWSACTTGAQCGGGTMTGGFVYDNPRSAVTNPVAPANAAIYRQEWTGGQFGPSGTVVPVGARAFGWAKVMPNGRYLVRLHFSEHNQRAIGKRVFDVDVEGGTKEFPGLDVFKEAGGFDRALVKEHVVDLTDGTLNVDLFRQVENAMVNGLEVVPVDTATVTMRSASAEPLAPLRLDTGGAGATVAGVRFAPCRSAAACPAGIAGGKAATFPIRGRLAAGARGRLYRTTWTGKRFTISVPVRTKGRHTVRLHFAEPIARRRGARVFDVAVEGRRHLRGFDVFAAAGGRRGVAVVRTVKAVVTDGRATIRFTARRGQAILSAVEVLPAR